MVTLASKTGNEMFSMFPVVPSKRNNAGGIAAAVIVVLLLIATLIALLVYYLRTRSGLNPVPFSSSSSDTGFSNETYEADLTVSYFDIQTFNNTLKKHPVRIVP